MSTEQQIRLVITAFVKAGDHRDTNLLECVLHDDFRVVSNQFMGTPGVTIIDKKQYIANVKDGVFGGIPRKMKIEKIEELGTIANVLLRLESTENYFVSFNSLVLDRDDQWKLIHNLAFVEAKK